MRIRKGVLKKTIISYIGIALLSCLVIGFTCLSICMMQLNRISIEEEQSRLGLVHSDLHKQMETMRSITLRVKTMPCYMPISRKESTLKERELILDLARFKNHLPYACDYYLYYLDDQMVYSGTAKYSASVFSEYVLSLPDENTFTGILSGIEGNTVLECPQMVDRCIFVLPFSISGHPAQMLFIVPDEEIRARAAIVSGLAGEDITIRYQEKLVIPGHPGKHNLEVEANEDNPFSLSIPARGFLDRFKGLILQMAALLFLVILVITIVCIRKAYRDYRPIQHILDRYVPSEGSVQNDEFQIIESLLDETTNASQESESRLQDAILYLNKQRDTLREYVLMHLLRNGASDNTLAELKSLDISMGGKYIALWKLSFNDRSRAMVSAESIEALSDDQVAFITVIDRSSGALYAIANSGENEGLHFALEIMDALTEQIHPDGVCFAGIGENGFGDLERLWHELEHPTPRDEDESKAYIQKFTAALNSMDDAEAECVLREIISPLESLDQCNLVEKGMLAEIIGVLMAFPETEKLHEWGSFLMQPVRQGDMRKFFGNACICIREINSARRHSNEPLAREITNYIQEHLGEFSFSLDSVAEHFGISTRLASNVIKEKTGLSYMDYVKTQRILTAKRMLVETDLSVAEIGGRIGYVNISYFIRTFKNDTGLTPANYRSTMVGSSTNE